MWLDPRGFQNEGQTWDRASANAAGLLNAGKALLRYVSLRGRGETEVGAQ
jgi:hypothetical protein